MSYPLRTTFACFILMNVTVWGAEVSEPVASPFEISKEATARRAKLYSVSGRAHLVGKETPLTNGMKIALFGDSITMQGGYIRNIQKAIQECDRTRALKVQLLKHGLNGGRVPTLLQGKCPWGKLGGSMQELIEKEQPDVVSIWVGINDVWHGDKGTTPEDFEAGLKKMISICKASDAKVVLATLAVLKEDAGRWNSKCDHYAQITRKVADVEKVTLVDLRKAFKAYLQNHGTKTLPDGTRKYTGKLLTYDGVHANAKGNEILADLIAEGIVDALKK